MQTVFPLGVYSAGNGKLYVSTDLHALITLCDNDVSTNGCVGSGSSGSGTITVPNAVNTKPVTIAQTGCTATTNAGSSTGAGQSKTDSTHEYPVGLVNFTLTGCTTGGTSTVTTVFAGVSSTKNLKLRKYNPTTQTYTDVPNAALTVSSLSGEPAVQAVYTITDGGSLDQDGTANGTIVDPVGLAAPAGTKAAGGLLGNTGAIAISSIVLGTLILLSLGYVFYDYRKHKKPLIAIDPSVKYTFGHHLKVVSIPLLKYRMSISFTKNKYSVDGVHKF